MYVDLKLLRKMHGRMQQSQLGEILGVTQSVISRMESMHYNLDDNQYSLLVEHFGATDVAKYVRENPLKNAISEAPRQRPKPAASTDGKDEDNLSFAIKMLSETVLRQADTISQMQEKITELNEHIAYLKQQSERQ